jgi:hypothetical protein
VISRISGLILAALAVETLLQGYRATFALPLIDCPDDRPTMTDAPHEDIPCADPADRVFEALAEALGQPLGTEQ